MNNDATNKHTRVRAARAVSKIYFRFLNLDAWICLNQVIKIEAIKRMFDFQFFVFIRFFFGFFV